MKQNWFEREEQLKIQIGIEFDQEKVKQFPHVNLSSALQNQGYCIVCYSEFCQDNPPLSLACGHQFCAEDWKAYLKQKVGEGFKECISATCQQSNCNIVVPHSLFLSLLDGDDATMYMKWTCKSFTDDNKNVRWCPNKGCDYCVEYQDYGLMQVDCKCGNSFCFKCGSEAHRPCSCEQSRAWLLKNSAESENVTWILANTKQCPNCKKPIEKNQGCNRMQCSACQHQFCWICLVEWGEHGGYDGYNNCNKFLAKKGQSQVEEEKAREKAQHELQRYMFFFERYNNHDRAEKLARKLKPKAQEKVKKLHDEKSQIRIITQNENHILYPISELSFLEDAIDEVISCRQVLKYTCVYGYYSPTSNLQDEQKRAIFQFQHENLEKNCDRLHELAEKPLDPFLKEDATDRSPFYHYRSELINYYKVTRKFYENLLEALAE